MQVTILTPRGERLHGLPVARVVLRRLEPTGPGSEIVLLENHADLLMRTAASTIVLGSRGAERRWEVSDGIAELHDDHLALFVDSASEVLATCQH